MGCVFSPVPRSRPTSGVAAGAGWARVLLMLLPAGVEPHVVVGLAAIQPA